MAPALAGLVGNVQLPPVQDHPVAAHQYVSDPNLIGSNVQQNIPKLEMKEDIEFAPIPQEPPGHQMISDSDTEDNDMSETDSETEDEVPMTQSPQIQRPSVIKPPKSTPLANQLNKDQDKKEKKKSTVDHPYRTPASMVGEVPSYNKPRSANTPTSMVGEVPSYNKPPKSTPLANQLNKDQDKKQTTQGHASFSNKGKKNNSNSRTNSRSTSRTNVPKYSDDDDDNFYYY